MYIFGTLSFDITNKSPKKIAMNMTIIIMIFLPPQYCIYFDKEMHTMHFWAMITNLSYSHKSKLTLKLNDEGPWQWSAFLVRMK